MVAIRLGNKKNMIKPYKEGFLKVDSIHEIYYGCYGNPTGESFFILHGGPGYGCDQDMLLPFDLSYWNIIMFDQRGAGKSKPSGCLQSNNTQELVEDIKKLADYLEVGKFSIKGESWGTTLGLLFAEKYPDYVKSMVLTGVFLGNNSGTLLGLHGGFERFYPEYWNHYIKLLPIEKRCNPYEAYYDYIVNGAAAEQQKFAKELICLELIMEMTAPDMQRAEYICEHLDYVNIAKIETYYTINDFFIEDNKIINDIDALKNVPITIVQGRHDLICPLYSAWLLSEIHPKCRLIVSEMGAHSDFSGNSLELIKNVINELKN